MISGEQLSTVSPLIMTCKSLYHTLLLAPDINAIVYVVLYYIYINYRQIARARKVIAQNELNSIRFDTCY